MRIRWRRVHARPHVDEHATVVFPAFHHCRSCFTAESSGMNQIVIYQDSDGARPFEHRQTVV